MEGSTNVTFSQALNNWNREGTGAFHQICKQGCSRMWMAASVGEQVMQLTHNAAMAVFHLVAWAFTAFKNDQMSDCVSSCVHDASDNFKELLASLLGVIMPAWGESAENSLFSRDRVVMQSMAEAV